MCISLFLEMFLQDIRTICRFLNMCLTTQVNIYIVLFLLIIQKITTIYFITLVNFVPLVLSTAFYTPTYIHLVTNTTQKNQYLARGIGIRYLESGLLSKNIHKMIITILLISSIAIQS